MASMGNPTNNLLLTDHKAESTTCQATSLMIQNRLRLRTTITRFKDLVIGQTVSGNLGFLLQIRHVSTKRTVSKVLQMTLLNLHYDLLLKRWYFLILVLVTT